MVVPGCASDWPKAGVTVAFVSSPSVTPETAMSAAVKSCEKSIATVGAWIAGLVRAAHDERVVALRMHRRAGRERRSVELGGRRQGVQIASLKATVTS